MDNSKQIIALYDDYNTIIKPLIAEVEARTEQFPLPLFNEIYGRTCIVPWMRLSKDAA